MPRPPRSTRTAPLFPYTTLVRSRQLETVALPQLRRTIGAMQDENRLAVRPFNMDMSGTMIVRIDHDPQAIYAQDSRHCRTHIKNPSARESFRRFAALWRYGLSPVCKHH